MDEMVLRIVERIEADPHADWSLETTAAAAGYSPFHFHRIFKAVVGVTLSHFVRACVMASAARQIILETPLEEVASRLNYSSPGAFSRSFKNYVGVSPASFRANPTMTPLSIEMRARREYTMKSKTVTLPEPIYVIGVQVLTNPPLDLNISTAWKGLSDKWTAIDKAGNHPRVFGLEEYSEDIRNRSLGISYIACVEAQRAAGGSNGLPEGTVRREIPAGTYAVFTHVGPTETLDQSFRHIYSEGLDALKVKPAAEFDVEVYDDRYIEGDPNSEIDIYVPVVAI